jgi:primary-amine oxidase
MCYAYSFQSVIYFNLGTHHIPHSGDIPNTLMTTSASSVMLIPHNFHDRDPSRASAQGVKLKMKPSSDGGGSNVRYFGAEYTKGLAVDLVRFLTFSNVELLLTLAPT